MFLFGALFGVAALLYFVRDVLVSLSPTSKTALLYGSAVVSFVAGLVAADTTVVLLFVLAGGLSIGATGYVLQSYPLGEVGTVLLLGGSSVVFVSLGLGLQSDALAVSPPGATVVAGAVTVAVVTVALFDRAESTTVVYDTEFASRYDGESVGTATVTNESRFRRSVTVPTVRVSLGTGLDERRRSIPADCRREGGGEVPDTLAPGGELRLRYVVPERQVEGLFERADGTMPETLAVDADPDSADRAPGDDSPQHRVILRPAD